MRKTAMKVEASHSADWLYSSTTTCIIKDARASIQTRAYVAMTTNDLKRQHDIIYLPLVLTSAAIQPQ